MSTAGAEMEIPGPSSAKPNWFPMWFIDDYHTGLTIDDHRLVLLVNTHDRGWQPSSHWGHKAVALASKLSQSGALSINGWVSVTD